MRGLLAVDEVHWIFGFLGCPYAVKIDLLLQIVHLSAMMMHMWASEARTSFKYWHLKPPLRFQSSIESGREPTEPSVTHLFVSKGQ
jgi:hypothetical protein